MNELTTLTAPDVEAGVLGALLIDRNAFALLPIWVTTETFADAKHKYIFEAMVQLNEARTPIDKITIYEQLKANDTIHLAGGAFYVAELTSKIGSSANIIYHCYILQQTFIKRELAKYSANIYKGLTERNADIFAVMDWATAKLSDLKGQLSPDASLTISDQLTEMVAEIQRPKDGLLGLPSGFAERDELTLGLIKKHVYVIGARPSMGKTAIALNIAYNVALKGKRVLIFSLETSASDILKRMCASASGIHYRSILSGNVPEAEWPKLSATIANISNLDISINDSATLHYQNLRGILNQKSKEKPIDLVVIDYLGLISSIKNEREYDRITNASREIKVCAIDFDVPIISLVQLSREIEGRTSMRPKISDLRSSGAIEQDADCVHFLYRPEQANQYVDERGNNLRGVGYLTTEKNKKGLMGEDRDIKLRWSGEIQRFTEYVDPPIQIVDNFYHLPAPTIEGAPF